VIDVPRRIAFAIVMAGLLGPAIRVLPIEERRRG
jgi:hypothetical protein